MGKSYKKMVVKSKKPVKKSKSKKVKSSKKGGSFLNKLLVPGALLLTQKHLHRKNSRSKKMSKKLKKK